MEGAHFESAKDNMLRIWFRNARGYFLVSFSAQTEANTVMNLINIIAHNDEYNNLAAANGHSTFSLKKNDIIWAGYVGKKGKRMGLYTPRFLVLEGIDLLLFKSHTNFDNGEDPSHKFSLLTCDFSQRAGMFWLSCLFFFVSNVIFAHASFGFNIHARVKLSVLILAFFACKDNV